MARLREALWGEREALGRYQRELRQGGRYLYALARDLLVADALHEGRLCRLSALSLEDSSVLPLWLVYPPALADSPGIAALRGWLQQELAASRRQIDALSAGTATAGPTGSRSRAASGAARGRRAR